MKYFYPSFHHLHHPSIDLSDGLPGYKHLEEPSRVDQILSGLLQAHECEVVYVEEYSDELVREIHDDDYVDFLLSISQELKEGEEYIPPVFRDDLSSSPLYFRGGMYCTEIGTPIGQQSIKAALNSAQTTFKASKDLLENDSSVFVLTRPPGHHAGKRRYGGYCFFNNSYIAAEYFKKQFKKVVVVDIDYHIGDGSIEFAHKDAPYFSLHSNTHTNYPYFDAAFKNTNQYVTLDEFQTGIDGSVYVQNVKNLLDKALKVNPEIIILSLGFDTLESDYCQDEYIYVKPDNFAEIGTLFGSLEQNVLILLEGGYDDNDLGLCAQKFMEGFTQAKGI